ncbi:MAG: hypothetical protein J6U08_04685 [Paludibacteraceae bacterium]|nr:hypothetical protein [Paludibacteraceae bacterium]MCR5498508.1 hypothetical protein [Paludibacteraceae bacterium]
MNITTFIVGLLFVAVGAYLLISRIILKKESSKLDILERKLGLLGKVIYIICYVLFPLLMGALLIFSSTLGLSLKDTIFS